MSHPTSIVREVLAAAEPGANDDARGLVVTFVRYLDDLAVAEAARAQFTREVLPRTLHAVARRQSRRWWALAPAVLVPALAVIALVVWQRRGNTPVVVDDDSIRSKGGLAFQMFANRGGEVI